MEQKTKIHAEAGKYEILITRDFDLPLELLFKAYTEAEFVSQWMGTHVVKLESKDHGSYRFETTDPKGNKHGFNGVIHSCITNQKIVRTFEMENSPFGIQLEFYEFEASGDETSKLTMRVLYESVEQRDQLLKLPFTQGINMAHNRIQDILSNSK
jgi:uncharacterized protein YndB with AHSA1/START domain